MQFQNREKDKKSYTYKTRREKVKLKLLDGMDSICESKGEQAVKRAQYYDGFDFKATDPEGSYTGIPSDEFGEVPVQDVDDL